MKKQIILCAALLSSSFSQGMNVEEPDDSCLKYCMEFIDCVIIVAQVTIATRDAERIVKYQNPIGKES